MCTGCGKLEMIKGYVANGIFRMGSSNYFKYSSVDQHLNIIIQPHRSVRCVKKNNKLWPMRLFKLVC